MAKKSNQLNVRRITAGEHFPPGRLALSVVEAHVKQAVFPHDHDFLEIVLITKGRGEHITSRRRILTSAGDVWIIRPGHWHTYMGVKSLTLYNCLVGQSLLEQMAPQLKQDPGAVELFWRGPAVQAGDGAYLLRLSTAARMDAVSYLKALEKLTRESLKSSSSNVPSGVAMGQRGNLWMLFGVLAKAADAQAKGLGMKCESTPGTPQMVRTPEVLEAIDFLESNYSEKLSVDDLAEQTGLSASHLTRLFRKLTGQSPMRYLASVRVQRACRLLAGTTKSITKIAGEVGWPDPNLFSRRFRENLGVSPRAYREQQNLPPPNGAYLNSPG